MKQNPQIVTIETPEHVEIQFELAGIGARFMAYVVDRCIQLCLVLGVFFTATLLLLILGKVDSVWGALSRIERWLGQWVIAVLLLLYGFVVLGYFMLFEYFWSGATPGKHSLHIRVIAKDGRPITFLEAAIRNILRFIDILGDVYPLGLMVMFFDSRTRRLGDLAAGTLVVLEAPVEQPTAGRAVDSLLDENPYLRALASGMGPADYQLVSRFLGRRAGLEEEHRIALARQIVDRITARASNPGSTRLDPEVLLESLEVLYRQRMRIL